MSKSHATARVSRWHSEKVLQTTLNYLSQGLAPRPSDTQSCSYFCSGWSLTQSANDVQYINRPFLCFSVNKWLSLPALFLSCCSPGRGPSSPSTDWRAKSAVNGKSCGYSQTSHIRAVSVSAGLFRRRLSEQEPNGLQSNLTSHHRETLKKPQPGKFLIPLL